jgi:putative flippase GtrA
MLPAVQVRTLLWFALTGVLGFLVDAGVLHAMVTGWNINLFVARACSFTCAATTTWITNRVVTFSAQRLPPHRLLAEWLAYFIASLGGGCLNFLVFAIAVRLSPVLHQMPVIAVGLGTLAGMTFNFLMYVRYVFRTTLGGRRAVKPDSPG